MYEEVTISSCFIGLVEVAEILTNIEEGLVETAEVISDLETAILEIAQILGGE